MRSFAVCLLSAASARVVDFEQDSGAIPNKDDNATWWWNGQALNATLSSLKPGDVFVIPNRTYFLMGGIRADNVTGVTIQIDGTLSYATDMEGWPRQARIDRDGRAKVYPCWYGENWQDVLFTSSGTGTMDGRGHVWWGVPGVGYLEYAENRPRLIHLDHGKNLTFENMLFKNSPYWTFYTTNVDGLEVRFSEISVKRDESADHHSVVELSAFNTDGFDVTGRNVWIHDVKIWNQDDCIAAKSDSENMLFERIEASGLGLTIGSIGSNTVRNITFRDVYMRNTVKGIYAKFRKGSGLIEDVTFENIHMDSPSQYAIWIGPAQQADSSNPCYANPCSLCWPQTPGAKCDGVEEARFRNIVLRNITVDNGQSSPGVLIAGAQNPMENVVFEDVRFTNPSNSPFGSDFYHCENAPGVARGSTWPVPACFKDETGTCQADGECRESGRSCCSGAQHSTLDCGLGRCGCIPEGSCATYQSDCCSGVGHKTLRCNAGVGFRCDAANMTLV